MFVTRHGHILHAAQSRYAYLLVIDHLRRCDGEQAGYINREMQATVVGGKTTKLEPAKVALTRSSELGTGRITWRVLPRKV